MFSAFEDIDELECSSDSPFLAVASLTNTNAGGTLSVVLEPAGGGLTALGYKIVEAKSLTFGAEAGDTLTLKVVEGAGIGDGVVAFITVQSPQGAEISCVHS